MLKVGFLGSSTLDRFSEQYLGNLRKDIKSILSDLFRLAKILDAEQCSTSPTTNLLVVNGGYGGLMEDVAKLGKEICSEAPQYSINICGVLFDGYMNDPLSSDPEYTTNQPNAFNDFFISSPSLGERVQTLIEMSDLIVALPGGSGTLHEILHCIEHLKYAGDYWHERNLKRLILHNFWTNKDERLVALNKVGIIANDIYNSLTIWGKGKSIEASSRYALGKSFKPASSKTTPPPEITFTQLGTEKIPEEEENAYLRVVKDINGCLTGSYGSRNYVLGLDLVQIDLQEDEARSFGRGPEILKLDTIGTGKYVRALEGFLYANDSILLNDEYLQSKIPTFEYRELSNLLVQPPAETSDLIYQKFPIHSLSIEHGDSDVEKWVNYLSTKKIGKSLVWIVLPKANNRYLVSAFVCFDIFLTTSFQKEIKGILSEFLYSHTLTELNNRLSSELKGKATRAAISQVMARNMSHNIGSHVMNHLTKSEDLLKLLPLKACSSDDIQKCIAEPSKKNYQKVFQQFDTSTSAYCPSNPLTNDDKDGFTLLAVFNRYLKYRMGYLGDVTFGTAVMLTTKRIWDIWHDLERTLLLLEHISGLSKFRYTIKFTFEGKAVTKTENNIEIAVPNDILGCQAFYNIIENVIRNTAKYAKLPARKPDSREECEDAENLVVFTVNFKEVNTDSCKDEEIINNLKTRSETLYQVDIYDNIDIDGKTKSEKLEDKEFEEKYKKQIKETDKATNCFTPIDLLIAKQNLQLNESILDSSMSVRSKGLGLLEMESSAAYLRREDVTVIESDDYLIHHDHNSNAKHITILKAVRIPDVDKNYLGYRFYVSKPQLAVLVGDFGIRDAEALKKDGVLVLTKEEFKNGTETLSHEFIVFKENEFIAEEDRKELVKEHQLRIPLRQLFIENFENFSFEDFNKEQFELWLWEKWFEELKTAHNIHKCGVQVNALTKNDENFQIEFIHHDNAFNTTLTQEKKNKTLDYFEPLSSFALEKLPGFKVQNNYDYTTDSDEVTPINRLKLFEAAVTRIIVIDERIQKYATGKSEGADICKIFEKLNVSVPVQVDLAANTLDEKTITNYIDEEIATHSQTKPFLIVHYGILERLYKDMPNWTQAVSAKLATWNEKANLVVTSGRGNPREIFGGAVDAMRFVHLSPILNVFTEVRSKFLMANLLYAARRSR